MKIIATRIPTPFDKVAFELYEEEFSNGEQGFILFPEGSIDEDRLSGIYSIANKYKIGIIGTLKEHNHQRAIAMSNNKLNIGPMSYPDQFIPNISYINQSLEKLMTQNSALSTFYKEDKLLNFQLNSKIAPKEFNSIVRICSDVALPYAGHDIADLLLIPSAMEHPHSWFVQHTSNFKKNLTKDAKIIYSPLATQPTFPKGDHTTGFDNQPMGIYNTNLNQLGKIKGDYVILNVKE